MKNVFFRFICAVSLCLFTGNSLAIVKNPNIDGQVDVVFDDTSIQLSCILSQDCWTILDTIVKNESNIDAQTLLDEICKQIYREFPDLKDQFTIRRSSGTFEKIKGKHYFCGVCTQDHQNIQGVRLIVDITTDGSAICMQPRHVAQLRMLSEYAYEIFCDMVKEIDPAQYYAVCYANKYKK